MSKIYFRYGAMNSGKSTHLMQVAHNYEERGMKVALIKPGVDTKGDNYLVSRLGIKRKVNLIIGEKDNVLDKIKEYILNNGKIDALLCDEVQFLKGCQIDNLFEVAITLDVPVICYGLRTDFQSKGFEGSERLLLIAHSIEELKTICKCGRKAILNGRKFNDEFIFKGSQVAIDNGENFEYEALCGNCYFELLKN